jgi:RNA ligase
MKLWQIMNRKQFHRMVSENYIRKRKHPFLDLYILNYTEHAQFVGKWNKATRRCRGLIIDGDYNIIARPFEKFFNYGQYQADVFLNDYRVEITDKLDGSLGIYWQYQGHHGIATRGSFDSDQAIHATKIWNEKYNFKIAEDWTYLFEIVYPANRIVLDYADMDDLILLGVMDIHEGSVIPSKSVHTWRGPKTTTYPFATLSEALAAPPRANAEGYVVYFPDLDYRVKIKQEDYVALHKIVTGLTKRRIWESMKSGKTLEDLLEIVPDEWHSWLDQTFGDIMAEFNKLMSTINDQFETALFQVHHWYLDETDIGFRAARKRFAEETSGMQYQGFMFQLLDNKDITEKVWDLVRPTADDVITNSN